MQTFLTQFFTSSKLDWRDFSSFAYALVAVELVYALSVISQTEKVAETPSVKRARYVIRLGIALFACLLKDKHSCVPFIVAFSLGVITEPLAIVVRAVAVAYWNICVDLSSVIPAAIVVVIKERDPERQSKALRIIVGKRARRKNRQDQTRKTVEAI